MIAKRLCGSRPNVMSDVAREPGSGLGLEVVVEAPAIVPYRLSKRGFDVD